MPSLFTADAFRMVFQIALIAVVLYYIFSLFRGTRSAQMLLALFGVTVALYAISKAWRLEVLRWLIGQVPLFLGFALVVIFQPEIRKALSYLGRTRLFGMRGGKLATSNARLIDTLLEVTAHLQSRRIGAIIAIEQGVSLESFCEEGTRLNVPIVPVLLEQIFYVNTPLHDGGVILRGDTIAAARCIFPLSQMDVGHGTRHRAGIGLSEETDAIVVIVSEETGNVSMAYQGRFLPDLTRPHLERYLRLLLKSRGFIDTIRQAIDQIELERGNAPDPSEDGAASADLIVAPSPPPRREDQP